MKKRLKNLSLIAITLMNASGAFAADDFQTCPNNGREKYWAQKRLNADLMNAYINDHKLHDDSVEVRVTVLDSGFDPSQKINLAHPESFSAEPGVFQADSPNTSLVGDPLNDINGHGTMVVGVIGGKDGIGVAPHTSVTLMRITPETTAAQSGSTSSAFIDSAIYHACTQDRNHNSNGISVINTSWISRTEEAGKASIQTRSPKLIQTLSDLGCLLVQSAGNDAFVGPLALASNDTGPVLSVSATGPFNTFASFSSTGLITAPGENVYTLASHLAKAESNGNFCEPADQNPLNPKTFVSGTSFSAPMTAGIAAEIVGVLETKHAAEFQALSPAKRIQSVIRILEASSLGSFQTTNIDAFRATLIAERFTGNEVSIDDYKKLLVNEPLELCGQTPVSFDQKRMLLAACRAELSQATLDSLTLDLETQAMQKSAFETLAGFLDMGSNQEELSVAFIKKYVEHFTGSHFAATDLSNKNTQSALRFSLDSSISKTLMPPYLRETQGQEYQLLLSLFTGYSAETFLRRGPGRGSEPTLQFLVDDLQLLDSNQASRLVKDFSAYWFGTLDPIQVRTNSDSLTTVVRVFSEIYKRPKLSAIWPTLDSIAPVIYEKINLFPARFGKDLDMLALYGEYYQNRSYVFDFLDSHPDLGKNYDLNHPENNAEVLAEYWAEKPNHSGLNFLLLLSNLKDRVPDWKYTSLTLYNEMPDLIKDALLKSNQAETDYLFANLNYALSNNQYMISSLVSDVTTQLSNAKMISNSDQNKIRILSSIIKQESSLQILKSSMVNLSNLHYLKVLSQGSKKNVYPSEFSALLAPF